MNGPSPGDEFVRLLAPHRDALYRYSRLMCWDPNRAEDVLSEAVLSAFRAFDRFEPGTNFKAWLFRFVHNTLLNENRRYRRELDTVDTSEVEVNETAPAARENRQYDLLEPPEREEFLEQLPDPVRRALTALSGPERMVFLLRSVEEFSYKEIGQLLGMPPGTAMSHMHRGMLKLRERLEDYAAQHGYRINDPGDLSETDADLSPSHPSLPHLGSEPVS